MVAVDLPRMGMPLKVTFPSSACVNPVIISKSVVFPAPFGPINPIIFPCVIVKVLCCTALIPPKDLDTFVICSMLV